MLNGLTPLKYAHDNQTRAFIQKKMYSKPLKWRQMVAHLFQSSKRSESLVLQENVEWHSRVKPNQSIDDTGSSSSSKVLPVTPPTTPTSSTSNEEVADCFIAQLTEKENIKPDDLFRWNIKLKPVVVNPNALEPGKA